MVETAPENISEHLPDQLDRIDRNIVALCQSIDDMRKDYSKIVFALIGVVTATIGAKFIGTPWYIDLAVYFTEFSMAFLFFSTIQAWKSLTKQMKATRVIAILLLIVSSVTQTIVYAPGVEHSPIWFPPVINVLLSLLAVTLVWSAWSYRSMPSKHKEANHGCAL